MSHGNKYHLQTTNDLQTLLYPPVQNDAFTQCALASPLYGDVAVGRCALCNRINRKTSFFQLRPCTGSNTLILKKQPI